MNSFCTKGVLLFGLLFFFLIKEASAQWMDISSNRNVVQFIENGMGFMAGDNGTLLKTIDNGNSWQNIANPVPANYNIENISIFAGGQILKLVANRYKLNGYVQYAGLVISSNNGGLTWQQNFAMDHVNWTSVFINEQTGWLVDRMASYIPKVTWKTTDGGLTWVEDIPLKDVLTMSFQNENIGWAVDNSNNGRFLLKTADGGLTWESTFGLEEQIPILFGKLKLIIVNDHTAWIAIRNSATIRNKLYKTIDSGQTWSSVNYRPDPGVPVFDYNVEDVFFLNEREGWIIANYGTEVYKTSNSGTTWEVVLKSDDYMIKNFNKVVFETETKGYVIGNNGFYATTNDGGQNWKTENYCAAGYNFAINNLFLRENEAWIMNRDFLLRLKNGQSEWQEVNTPNIENIYGMDFYGYKGALVGKGFMISDDMGETWEKVSPSFEYTSGFSWENMQVYMRSPSEIWLSGVNSNIYKSLDRGRTFKVSHTIPSYSVGTHYMLEFQSDSIIWAYDNKNNALAKKSTDGGKSWQVTNERILTICFLNETIGWKYMTNKNLYKTSNGGINWELMQNLDFMSSFSQPKLTFVDENAGWISSILGKVYHTVNGGKNWSADEAGVPYSISSMKFDVNSDGKVRGLAGGSRVLKYVGDYKVQSNFIPKPPQPPSDLSVTPGSRSSLNLAWVDNSADEIGFIVERSEDGISFRLVHSTDPNVTSFNDLDLMIGKTYYYRIKALKKGLDSEYSAIVSGIPLSIPRSMYLPQENTFSGNRIEIDFDLQQDAVEGTVQLRFTRSGGEPDLNSPHIITFDAFYETRGRHYVILDGKGLDTHENVVAVSSSPSDALVSGAEYTVEFTFQFQNQEGMKTLTDAITGFKYDDIPPVKPGKPQMADGSDSGIDKTDGITNVNMPELKGTTEANAKVAIFSNEELISMTKADANGKWFYTLDKPLIDGNYQFSVIAIDAARNESEASDILTVTVDTELPTALVKDFTVELSSNGTYTLNPSEINKGSYDNLTSHINLSLFLNRTDLNCEDVGTTHDITLAVSDIAGNVSTATSKVQVVDNISPIVKTKDIKIELDAFGMASIGVKDVDDGSSDACGAISLNLDNKNFSCSDLGINTVTLTAIDESGNMASASAIVTVVDVQIPIITIGQRFVIKEKSDNGTVLGSISASDNCELLTWAISGGNTGDAFTISSHGLISVNNREALDYESNPEFILQVSAEDMGTNLGIATVIIELSNESPVLAFIPDKIVNENELLNFTIAVKDPENGGNLQYSLGADAPAGASLNSFTGEFTWTPTEKQGPGTFNFSVRVSDGVFIAEQKINVNVLEVNQAPVITSEPVFIARSGEEYFYHIQASDPDLPANTLEFDALIVPSWLSFDSATQILNGIPDSIQEDSHLVKLQVSDGFESVIQEFSIQLEKPTGLFDRQHDNLNALVYPNPTSGRIVIEWESQIVADGTITVILLDLGGRILVQYVGDLKEVTDKTNAFFQEMKAGIYLLQLKAGEKVKTVKLIKE